VALLGLMRYHPVLAFCILPAFLATPYLVPLRVVVARWFTAATAFVFFMGAMKVFVQDREDKELGVKLRKEAFHQYMLRFIPLKASPSQNYAPYAMYRVGAILIKYTLANALFIEHAACLENRPSSLIQEIAYRYATGLGVYLWVNSMSEPVMVFWMLMNGVIIEEMFARPYLATSLSDFWSKRWNVLITTLFKRTVYIPLGGKYNYYQASAAVFLVSAIFHEYTTFVSGMPSWHNLLFFCGMGLGTMASVKAGRLILPMVERTPGIQPVVTVVSFVATMCFLLLLAPFFYEPYIKSRFFEKAIGALPWHSVDSYPLSVMICPAQP